ncbi:hypothetical protein LCGC14_2041500, partial [marine sediment metagenome]
AGTMDDATKASEIRDGLVRMRTTNSLKDAAKALAGGHSFANPGDRHDKIVGLTWTLAKRDRRLSARVIEELFSASLAAMRAVDPDCPDVDEAIKAYQTAVEKMDDSAHQPMDDRERKEQARSAGASGPYEEGDLKGIAAAAGCELEQLGQRWIIQCDSTYWFLDGEGMYVGPFTEKGAMLASRHILARAPIRMRESTRSGYKWRSLVDVTTEAGQSAYKVISDLTAVRARFDDETKTLYEAVCPLRKLEPKFDPLIDEWLRKMGGPQHGKLVDWLACASDLSKLLCAIYFDGPKSSGKTLFAHGVAAMWTEGPPAEIDSVISDFNEDLARCPVVFADEDIPKPRNRTTVTTVLRSMLSTTQRTLKRKFKAPTELRGAIRLILAANNETLLDSRDVSSSKDLEAIAERFLYINVGQEAVEHLETISRVVKERWLTDGIARHALWLREHHVVEIPGKRFWVEGDIAEMHRLLMTASKWNSMACEWLVRYCMTPELFDSKATGLIRRGDGELLVNDQALIDGFDLYLKMSKIDPDTAKLGSALRALTKAGTRRQQLRTHGKRVRYRIIDVDHLIAWADRHNIGDRQAILESVGDTSPREPGDDADDTTTDELGTVPAVNSEDTPF